MNTGTTYRFSFIAIIAVISLIGSITHYHSEGLECLTHADEQHYVQNEIECPICTLVVSLDLHTQKETGVHLYFELAEIITNDVIAITEFSFSEPGRAPPSIV